MFTGLVEDVGRIERAERREGAVVFSIEPSAISAAELEHGESVAINGVCLTVTQTERGRFSVLAGGETLRRTALGQVRAGTRVNLERALRLGDRLGGHLVQGHVDGVGRIASRRDLGSNLEIAIRTEASILRYVVAKGSVTVDGISLTVNEARGDSFAVALIPHTVANTTLADRRVGDTVNLEVDLIAKYVEKLTTGHKK